MIKYGGINRNATGDETQHKSLTLKDKLDVILTHEWLT